MDATILDAHDRLIRLRKLSGSISKMCQRLIDEAPFGQSVPFYAFAHARTTDDGLGKRLIWQPRLTKPKAQENSMLFKLYPAEKDKVKVIWMIPQRELWRSYESGKLLESNMIRQSIRNFLIAPEGLEQPEKDDWSDEQIKDYYHSLRRS